MPQWLYFRSLGTKITLTFILIVIIIGVVSILSGIRFIDEGIINQVQTRVRADLNAAREIYGMSEERYLNIAKFTADKSSIKDALLNKERERAFLELRQIRKNENMDFVAIADRYGNVVLRSHDQRIPHDNVSYYNIVNYCLQHAQPAVATELLTREQLYQEDSTLVSRAQIKIVPTLKAKYQREGYENTGMVIFAAAPVFDDSSNLFGVLYCGKLINNNVEIVDKIKNTVFLGEKYKGRDIGTATIFLKDLRISTNVMNLDGTRAIGTLISKEVYEAVIEKGKPWLDRAFVVNDWYITSYKPMKNIKGDIVGVLYVGILERRYTEMKNQFVFIFIGITLLSMVAVFGLSYILTVNITKPLRDIGMAARRIAQGDFPQKIEVNTEDEIADLGRAFQYMISSLKARDQELKESISKTAAEADRLATIGQLAAGVAHEINNPLTSILLYCDLVLHDMPQNDPRRRNLEKVNNEAKRCKTIIKGLLNYSRPKKPEVKESSIDAILESTLSLIKNQALFQNITIKKEVGQTLPLIKIDPTQIQQVFMNLVINAAEAMEGKGYLTIGARRSPDNAAIEIIVSDTGPGIAPKNIKKIFEPFFTTKDAKHGGVGLGLAISNRIIVDHGGTISVTSEPGKGATFVIHLPLRS